jgi:DNA-binding SARP family transcriptional activator/predicted ATPase
MPRLNLYLLGSPRILLDGAPLSTDRRKAVAMLAYLALNKVPVTRAALADLFWPDFDPESAFSYLRRTLWELNHVLGKGWIEADREQIALRRDPPFWLDVEAFQVLLGRASGDITLAAFKPVLEEAIALYRGDFLAGFSLPDSPAFDEWQLVQAESLRRKFSQALEKLSLSYEQAGNSEPALEIARRWLALDPLEEAAHRRIMQLYARQGNRLAALRQYDTCVQVLQKELDVEPQPETTALYDQIRQGKAEASKPAPDRQVSDTKAHPASVVRPALPPQSTLFVGRSHELKEISHILRDPAVRLLTLVGPGGAGKTRLAIQAALLETGQFSDGACFVPLAGITSPEHIIPTIAKMLELPLEKEASARRIFEYLWSRHMLIILDNYEHLISDESVNIPLQLVAAGESIKVLVTSREGLNVSGEQRYRVTGMNTPPETLEEGRPEDLETYSSVHLFIQSARRMRPDFKLDTQNMKAVVQICRLVQGLPLAIELSAGWVGLLSPAEILSEIKRGLDFLETNQRDIPARQRSMRVIFESSWKLLSLNETRILNILSLFPRSFDRQAAESIAEASLKDLASLENKSLLQVKAEGRFEIHPLLREYAAEHVQRDHGLWQHARQIFVEYFFNLLENLGEDLKGPKQGAAYKSIEADILNFTTAWHWAVDLRQFKTLDRGLIGLLLYFNTGFFNQEHERLLEKAIQALETPPPTEKEEILLLAKLLALYSNSHIDYLRRALELLRQIQGEKQAGFFYAFLAINSALSIDQAEGLEMLQHAVENLRQANDRWAVAAALRMLGNLFVRMGRREDAIVAYSESVDIARQIGDKVSISYSLLDLAGIYDTIDHARADQLYEEVLSLAEAMGQRHVAANIHFTLGHTFFEQGNVEKAMDHLESSRLFFREIGNRVAESGALSAQSYNLARFGDFDRARQMRQQSLDISTDINDQNGIVWSMWEMGEIERLGGNLAAARQLYEQSRHLCGDNPSILLLAFYYRGLGDIAQAEGHYSKALQAFTESLGYAQKTFELWIVSYALSGLGRAELGLGLLEEADSHFKDALQQARRFLNRDLEMAALAGFARSAAARGQYEQAVELASFVRHRPFAWQETKNQAALAVEEARSHLTTRALQAAHQRGEGIDLQDLEIKYALI